MTSFLSKVGEVLTAALGWCGDVASAIVGDTSGILITATVMSFCLFGIHIYRSLSGK